MKISEGGEQAAIRCPSRGLRSGGRQVRVEQSSTETPGGIGMHGRIELLGTETMGITMDTEGKDS